MRIIARIGGFGALLLGVTVWVTSMTWVSGDPLYQFAADGLQQGAIDTVRARAIDRRLQHLQDIRTARDITQPGSSRSLAQAAGSHDANLTEVPEDPSLLFGDDVTCLLQPDTTAGPFFIDGQQELQNITYGEEGIDLFLHLRLVDVNTCMPVEGLLLDVWHANATGSYSGVENVTGNFLRGMVATDADGIATIQTIYPGHYTGRCHHVHMLAWEPGTEPGANIIGQSEVLGVGQIYFDDDLNTAVSLLPPYNSSSEDFLTNSEDFIFEVSNGTKFDPVAFYTKVGDSLSDGIFAWITIGVDLGASVPVQAAATVPAAASFSETDMQGPATLDTGSSPVSLLTSGATEGVLGGFVSVFATVILCAAAL